MAQHGLGRLPAEDTRDLYFRMALHTAVVPAPTQRVGKWIYAPRGPLLNQGSTSSCVGHAWRNWLAGAPLTTSKGPSAFAIYDAAIKVDEWSDNDDDPDRQFGTSVRAGAKVLASLGHIESYLWAWNVDDVLDWMLTGRGGVVLGTDWHEGMFTPDAEGIIRPTGPVAGGHAYWMFGADEVNGWAYIENSWGQWGGWKAGPRRAYAGCARLALDDLDRLIRDGGEACTAIQKKMRAA